MRARFLVLALLLFFLAVGAAPPPGEATVPIDMESDTSGVAAGIAYDRYGKISFAMEPLGVSDIFVVNPDGSNLVNLTEGSSSASAPTWSPDGSQIAFVVRGETSSAKSIRVMNADGSGIRLIVDDIPGSPSPAWSPDGSDRLCRL